MRRRRRFAQRIKKSVKACSVLFARFLDRVKGSDRAANAPHVEVKERARGAGP